MSNLEYIENYFTKNLPLIEAREFEQKMLSDHDFAEEVAFYLSAQNVISNELVAEKKERFKALYNKNKPAIVEQAPVRKIFSYIAAAAVVTAIFVGVWFWMKPSSPANMADSYIKQHLNSFGVTMSSELDNLQAAKVLYNQGKLQESLSQFENIASRDSSLADAKKFAGIVSLRLSQYDKALLYFGQLESYTGLYSNPALFFRALTMMKRNLPGDRETAKKLLQTVVDKNYEGADTARKWLTEL